jgi:general transcription factor 3C polypeptide 3 (transcription factor C subunit 4)
MMNDALGQIGLSQNVDRLLYEDEDAMMEMDTQLGPDIDPSEYQQFPNFEMSRRRKKKRRLKKSEKAYAALPDHLNAIMMKANMLYIQGREDESIQMLKDVIKERADAHEAWLTLAMIYNSKNDVPRTIQCKMMAAHLSSSNSDLWRPLGFSSKYITLI